MKRALPLSLAAAVTLFGAAYKIPEQSARSVALAGAYVAAAKDADAAYYNPANMSFMDGSQYIELSLTAAYLPKIKYSGVQYLPDGSSIPADNKSRSEKFLIPHFHYVGPAFDKWRVGFSITTPAGTSKRWESEPQSWFAKRYTLRVAEAAPSISYRVSDNFSLGASLRAVFTDGRIVLDMPGLMYDLDGDIQTKFGWALAASYQLEGLTLAATFRSKVDLDEEGDATIIDTARGITLNTTGQVSVPLPAMATLAAALQVSEKATVEFVYERTFWGGYENLHITFDGAASAYNIKKAKNWDDTNTFRIGLTYKKSDRLTTMFGMAYDETPVPSGTLGYELPDSDALIFSAGAIYALTEKMNIGIAYLYDYKLDRTIEATDLNNNGIAGTFSNIRAHLLDFSIAYRF